MKRVNEILIQITKASGFARKIKAHLTESLHSGELSRLRQRIQFFNAALSLPIQMVCVMLQLEQRGMSVDHHKSLDVKLVSLERNMRDLVQNLNSPNRSQTLGGTTVAGSSSVKSSQDEDMKTYVAFAKQFLVTASAAASTRSSLSTVSPAIEPDVLSEVQERPSQVTSPPIDRRSNVEGWLQGPSAHVFPLHTSQVARSPSPGVIPAPEIVKEDNEVEFMRTKQHLKLGQDGFDQNEFTKAERHFRRALALMKDHDFEGRIAFQPAEVVLMLAESCLKQDKLDEAASLLSPVAAMRCDIFPQSAQPAETVSSGRGPDKLQALAASHMLGRVYILKGDFDQAETHGLKAFMERRKELGPRDEKTLESVKLVIDIYRARGEEGDEEEAEGYEVFLASPEKQTPATSTDRLLGTAEDPPRLVPALVIPEIPRPEPQHNVPRASFVNRIRHMGRSSQTGLAQSPPSQEMSRLSFSRSNITSDPHDPDVAALLGVYGMNSPSEASTHERALSMSGDDESVMTPSTGRLSRSSSSWTLEPTFRAIADLCVERKLDQAAKVALQYLDTYPSSFMVIRKPELKDNIKNGHGVGLARTGRGYSPLHFFCELKEEHPEEVNLLIRQGVDVNAVGYKAGYTVAFKAGYTHTNPRDPFTALMQVTERGHSTIASLLLSVDGINVDVRDSEGYTPLMVACRKGHHSIVKQLLEFPLPTVFPPAWHGSTLLHDASRRCDPVLVEILLSQGQVTTSPPDASEVDQRDKFGKTALMHAVVKADIPDPVERRGRIKGRCRTVQVLLEAGADPTLRDHRTGKTVRAYAVEEDDAELLMVLESAGRVGVWELGG